MDEVAFERERSHLRALAYRMLGSQAEAEDVLQEAWLRWRGVSDAESPRAYLTAMVTRLCLDQLKSARARREVYVGPWLPEPMRTVADEPDRESISLAFLRLLEQLAPVERAVFLLHQVFDYSHAEVARVVGKDEAAVRQILHRARERVQSERPRFAASREEHARLLHGFLAAIAGGGDVAAVEALLAGDAIMRTDAGGKARAALRPVIGANEIARFCIGLGRKGSYEGRTVEPVELNGWPGALIRWQGAVEAALAIETDGERIYGVDVVSNPDKLARLG